LFAKRCGFGAVMSLRLHDSAAQFNNSAGFDSAMFCRLILRRSPGGIPDMRKQRRAGTRLMANS
jgi:hypothetical protein